jgi:predicted nucleic acid-binding protein
MYLVDTNLIAEILLRQTKAEEVKRFLESTIPEGLYLTEFSLYSLGIILLRRKMHDTFLRTVDDLLLTGGIRLLRLGLEDMQDIVDASRRFNLDFDDAYQYATAEKYNLILVSFDGDCSDPLELDNHDSSSIISPRKGKHYVKASSIYARVQSPGSLGRADRCQGPGRNLPRAPAEVTGFLPLAKGIPGTGPRDLRHRAQ